MQLRSADKPTCQGADRCLVEAEDAALAAREQIGAYAAGDIGGQRGLGSGLFQLRTHRLGFRSAIGIGTDRIAVAADVNGTGVSSASDLLSRLGSDAAGDTVLELGSGNTVTLIGVSHTDVTVDSIVLT